MQNLVLSREALFPILTIIPSIFWASSPNLRYWPFTLPGTWGSSHTLLILSLQHPLSINFCWSYSKICCLCKQVTVGKHCPTRWDWCWLELNFKSQYILCFLIKCTKFYLCSCQGKATYDEFILTFSISHAKGFGIFLMSSFSIMTKVLFFSMNASICLWL